MDALVLVLTWMKTFGTKRMADRVKMKAPLASILWRDGKGFGSVHVPSKLLISMQALFILCTFWISINRGTKADHRRLVKVRSLF